MIGWQIAGKQGHVNNRPRNNRPSVNQLYHVCLVAGCVFTDHDVIISVLVSIF
ncbi:hypothetical protein N9P65_01275 [Alphaproteobacteria bacterium]|nr:hypothetical protein [Alphaproteobacteria bacterium]